MEDRAGLQPAARPFGHAVLQTAPFEHSGTEPLMVGDDGIEPPPAEPTDLQSALIPLQAITQSLQV